MAAHWDSFDPELEAQITASPDDDTLRRVYADWLIDAGNPRGELAALQLAGHPSEAFIEEHADALFGTFLLELPEIVWKAGFWDEVEYFGDAAAMLAHPSARLLRRLRIPAYDSDELDRYVREIAAVRPAALRTLVLGAWAEGQEAGGDAGRACLELPRLCTLPRLEELTVRASDFRLGDFPALRTFVGESMDLYPTALRSLFAARLPKLEQLSLWMSALEGCHVALADFAPLLEGDLFPALRQLDVICDPEVGSLRDQLAQAATASPLATRTQIRVTG